MHFESTLRRAAASTAALLFGAGLALAAGPSNGVPFGSDIPGSRKLPNGATLIPMVHHDVSLPLAAIPPNPPGPPDDVDRAPGRIPINLPGGRPDPVRQTSAVTLAMPTSSSFEGMGAGLSGFSPGGTPPDTNGDIGPNHYVQTVNSSVTVFSRSGAILLGPENINTLWSGFGGGCQTNNDGDPVVKYDRAADRWVVSQFAVSSTPYLQCVAVSATNDPTGSWNRYSFSFGSSNFNDYPKMGVWPDGYYFSFNIFANGSTFSGGMACAYDRAGMIAGGTAKAAQCFGPEANDGGLLPSDLTGSTLPPGGSPDYYVDLQTSSLNLWRFHVDWTTPSNSSFTGPTSLAVASYSALCGGGTCVKQPGTSQQLDSLADRLMYRLGYRNMGSYESLVVNHSVTSGSGGGVRWYEIRSPGSSPTIFQQGTFAPDSSYRWMGSAAMDHMGDIAIGYSISDGSSVKPGIRFAGRLVGDPAGQLSQGESTMVTGGGVNTGTYSRWGDYSSLSIDPTDDCTFWYTTEYYGSNGDSFHWQTRVGNFKFSSCSTTSNPDFSISASPASVSVVQGNAGTSTVSTSVVNGFNNAVSLSASGQPSGVTVSFNPTSIAAPGSGSSTMTMAVASSTATGTYAITVTGTGGGITHTASVSLTVTAAPTPDFTIAASPTSVSAAQGGSGTSTISTAVSGGFNNAISLSASGQPSGVTVSFNPTSIAAPGSGSSTMTMAVGSSVATGTYAITVTGSGGGITHTASVSLTVTAAGGALTNGNFETGNFTGWTTAGSAAVSTAAKHSGTYGAQVGSTSPSTDSSIVQTFTLPTGSPTLSFWYSVHCPDTVTYDWATASLKDNVTGTTSTLLAKTCTNTGAWVQVNYAASSSAGHSVTLTLASHDDNYSGDPTYTYYDDVAVTVPNPDFSLSASPTSVSVVQGSSGASTISTTVSNGFNNAVSLSASGQPSGVTVSFNPTSIAAPGSGSSTMTMAVASSTTTGTYTITVTGSGGGITHTASVSLTVTSGGTAQQLLANPGFESGNVSWTASSGVIDNSTGEPAHSGSWKAWLDGYGSTHTDTLLQQVAIPSNVTTATLTFWLHIDTAETTTTTAYDKLNVQIRNSSGTVLATLATYSNLNANTGYAQKSFNLISYKGQTIQVYLVGTEDASLQTSFVVDDFALNVQ